MSEKLIPLTFEILKSKEHLKYFADEMRIFATENPFDATILAKKFGVAESRNTDEFNKHSYFIKADSSLLLGEGGLAPYNKHVVFNDIKLQLTFIRTETFSGDTKMFAWQLSVKIINEYGEKERKHIPFEIKKKLAWAFYPVGTKILVCDETPANMFLAIQLTPIA